MTSTPDLNIAGSPIYEYLVATTGDPYQPPAYQLPPVPQPPPPDAQDAPYTQGAATGYGAPAMLSQFLSRMLGDGQSWVAMVFFGGPIADQLRHCQPYQHQANQYQPYQQYQMPQSFGVTPQYGYADGSGFGAMSAEQAAMAQAYQAYQQMMMNQSWAAQQQAMPVIGQQPLPLALTAGPAPQTADVPYPAPPSAPDAHEQATAGYGGMATPDWASWLGQTSQSVRPQSIDEQDPDELEAPAEPELSYERRGGGLTSRLGAAMRELRGR